MNINFDFESEEIFDEGFNTNDYLKNFLKDQIIKEIQKELKADVFNEFSELTKNEITANIKTKLHNFVNEEIVLTDRWGKNKFVGSIEDLMKQSFDDILLKHVDSNGKTLSSSCSANGITWIEWMINEKCKKHIKDMIDDAQKIILNKTNKYINEKLIEIKDSIIKKEIDNSFLSLINKG